MSGFLNMNDTERAGLLAEAATQHSGGISGNKGYRYQDFVTIIELLRGATRARQGEEWHIEYIQEAKESFTDDLHILVTPRRHIQIKSVDGQSWEAALRLQFSNERKLHPDASLELCVHDAEIEESLKRNRSRWGLEKVQVYCVPFALSRRPYTHEYVRYMLRPFMKRTDPDHVYMTVWNHLRGVWMEEFGDQGFLDELFEFVCKTSESTKPLQKAPPKIATRLRQWNLVQQALIFSADGRSLNVEFPGTEFDQVMVPLDQVPDEFWEEDCATSPWDVFHGLGQFAE